MKMLLLKSFFLLITLMLLFQFTGAQTSDLRLQSATGNTLSSGNYIVDFTIGEAVVIYVSNNQNQVTIGYLQPALVPFQRTTTSNFVSLYPVPTTDVVNYLFDDPAFIPTSAQIFNMTGSLLQSVRIPANSMLGTVFKFNVSVLPSGNYRIRLLNSSGSSRTGSFIKL